MRKILSAIAIIGVVFTSQFAYAQPRPVPMAADPYAQYKVLSKEFASCVKTNIKPDAKREACFDREGARLVTGIKTIIGQIKEDVIELDPSGRSKMYYDQLIPAWDQWRNISCEYYRIAAATPDDAVDLINDCNLREMVAFAKRLHAELKHLTGEE